jgi:hypothetical protein
MAMQTGALAVPAWPLSDEDWADEATMALRRKHEAVTWRIAGQVHVLPPKTQADVVDLMLRLGLIQRVRANGPENGIGWGETLGLTIVRYDIGAALPIRPRGPQ